MDDLVHWLLEQVATDEAEATAAFSGQTDPENGWGIDGRAITPHVGVIHEEVQRTHVAKWNPARVLAECEAKRRIIDLVVGAYAGYAVLPVLALPYATRPGYREEWKP